MMIVIRYELLALMAHICLSRCVITKLRHVCGWQECERIESRTDGCGLIREDLANMVVKDYGKRDANCVVPPLTEMIAFQGRIGGDKVNKTYRPANSAWYTNQKALCIQGMWLVVPYGQWMYGEKRLVARESQRKFDLPEPEEQQQHIEVLRHVPRDKAQPGNIGHQAIPLLVARGLSYRVLPKLFYKELQDLTRLEERNEKVHYSTVRNDFVSLSSS